MTPMDWLADRDANGGSDNEDELDPAVANHSSSSGSAVAGSADWRAGAFVPGAGLLGLIKVSDADADPYPLSPAYRVGPNGSLQLQPGFAQTHPKGPFDWTGMASEIDWPGVVGSLGKITKDAKSFPTKPQDLPGYFWRLGQQVWRAQDDANKKPASVPGPGVDRATNGLP